MDTMAEQVPVRKALADVYPADALLSQGDRWNRLSDRFLELYGRRPDFIARSPGRVAIIGEHIDYSLYPVMPMGILADVVIAVAATNNTSAQGKATIRVSNLDGAKYEAETFSLSQSAMASGEMAIDRSKLSWTNYFKAGMAGALQMLKKDKADVQFKDLDILVHGTVPAGGGVSSSAAFVSTSALAFSYAHDHLPNKKDLTEAAIVSERSVGVNSGGMDQAGSILSIRGDALFVEFYPTLNAVAVPFPKTPHRSLTFLIAQSFVVSNKAETGPIHYNLRVVECTLAALYLAAKLGLPGLPSDHSPLGYSLRGLEESLFASANAPSEADASSPEGRLKYMLSLVEKHLPDEGGYTREQVAETIGIPVADLDAKFTTKMPVRATHFKLRQRAKHVFSEALRVHRFVSLMRSTAEPTAGAEGEDKLLGQLGGLMNETQASCRDLYECSCPEIEQLCAIARTCGSYGSRLTGAGWGGCSVHLVPRDKVDAIKKAWHDEYYSSKTGLSQDQLDDAVVVTEPGNGAMILEFDN